MHPTTYVLEDISGEPIIGFFYKFEQLKTYYGKTDWSRFYKQALDTINFTPHSQTKISPFAMETNPSLAGVIFMKKFGHFVKAPQKHIPPSQKQIKFPVGTWVRFLTFFSTFAKGSTATFSGETFKVHFIVVGLL